MSLSHISGMDVWTIFQAPQAYWNLFSFGGGLLHEMLANSPIWKRILSCFSKRAVPCAALIDIHNTMTQQWGPFFQASLWAVSCSESTGNGFFNEASKLNSINQHHWWTDIIGPQKTTRSTQFTRYHLQKLPRCFRLAGIQFKGCQVGTHFFRVELLTKVHPCDQFSVLQPEIQTLWDQQSSVQVKKPWNAPMEKKGLGKNKNTKWPTPLIQILDQGGWMFSLRGTSCKLM